MRTFIAQAIYRIECAGVSTEQYEEQWRLVYAAGIDEALSKALEVSRNEECMFIDRQGRTVHWKLLAVKDIREILLEDGELLVSAVKEASTIADPVWIE